MRMPTARGTSVDVVWSIVVFQTLGFSVASVTMWRNR